MQTIVLVTGGFDPIHSGHIAYFETARLLGDRLVVGLNSDAWLRRKKGQEFLPLTERERIVGALSAVDETITYDDSDGSSKAAILGVRARYPEATIIFANGGDRTLTNIPEMDVADHNIEFVFGVGGDDKKNSSSWILQEWKAPKTERAWGYYRVLHEVGSQVKLKELTVMPGLMLSMQRHARRAEFWFVATGAATVYTLNSSTDVELVGRFGPHENIWIRQDEWHMLANEGTQPLRLIEIQYGDGCVEEDIERRAI